MSAFTSSRRPAVVSTHADDLFHRAAAAALFVLRWPMRVHANRLLLRQMSRMSDYELSDIGLTRNDLFDSAALPIDSEVDAFFTKRAIERRRTRY